MDRKPVKKKTSIVDKRIKDLATLLKGDGVLTGDNIATTEFISSGILSIDYVLGSCGVPRGRIIELFGTPSSGKTTLVLQLIRNFQKEGLICAFIDVENALSDKWASMLGVDLKNILYAEPKNGEETFEIIKKLVKGGADLIVVDSVAAIIPKDELEQEAGKKNIATQARLMSQELKKLNSRLVKTNTTVIFLNQTRSKVGIMFGNPEDTPGGVSLKFYSSVRLRMSVKCKLKKANGDIVGVTSKVNCVKSKVFIPFKSAVMDIYYTKGINKESGIWELALEGEVIKKTSKLGTYKFGEIRFKKKEFTDIILNNKEFRKELFG